MKYVIFTSNNGSAIVCTPVNEEETLENFNLNSDKTAPEGYERCTSNKPYVWIQPRIKKSDISG